MLQSVGSQRVRQATKTPGAEAMLVLTGISRDSRVGTQHLLAPGNCASGACPLSTESPSREDPLTPAPQGRWGTSGQAASLGPELPAGRKTLSGQGGTLSACIPSTDREVSHPSDLIFHAVYLQSGQFNTWRKGSKRPERETVELSSKNPAAHLGL